VTSSKRQRILDGALEAVGAEGYEQTSVRTVLDRSGVYRQAFYDNFTDKDDCYLQAYDAAVARIEARLVAAATGQSWRDQLRAGLRTLLSFLDEEPDVGRALIVEVHAAGAAALEKRAAAMQRIIAFLEGGREASEDGASSPPIASEAVVAGVHAVIHSRLASGASDGFVELLPEFMYFAVLPYLGVEAASAELDAGAGSSGPTRGVRGFRRGGRE
jgi:AcrR family transcriptional regulator